MVARAVVLLLLLGPATSSAQGLSVSVRAPQPDRLTLEDPWRLDLVNGSGQPTTVALRVRVNESSRGLVYEAQSSDVTVPPGTQTLDSRRVGSLHVVFVAPTISTSLDRLGEFPDGHYTVCVDATPTAGGAVATDCLEHDVASVQSPVLISPYNDEPVTDPLVVWSWFMQPVTRTGEPVTCDLTVVEILPHQTPEEALRVNPPTVLRAGLRSSTWQTNQAVRTFHPGASYAWQMTARVGSTEASRSEIWTFRYRVPTDSSTDVEESGWVRDLPYVPGRVQTWPGAPGSAAPSTGGAISSRIPPVPVDRTAISAAAPPVLALVAPTSPPPPPPPPPGPGSSVPSPSPSPTGAPSPAAPGATVSAPPTAASVPAAPTANPSAFTNASSTPVTLSMRDMAMGEAANRPGALSRQPAQYARLEVDPVLTIYGAPLTLNLLLATDQMAQRTDVTRGALVFQPRSGSGFAIRQQVATPPAVAETASTFQQRADSLRRAGVSLDSLNIQLDRMASAPAAPPTEPDVRSLTATGRAVSRLPGVAFGSVAPDYSTLFMRGVTMNGGMIENQGQRYYEALAIGKVQREEVPAGWIAPGAPSPLLFRTLYAGRVGVGQVDGTHLILSSLYARDDDPSRAILALADTLPGASLQDNWVVGLAGRASPGHGTVVDGEINTSLFNRDRNAPAADGATGSSGLFGRENVHNGGAVDWAGSLRSSWMLAQDRTRLAAGVRFVGPGYQSVGVRGLRTDVRSYDGAWDQSMLRDRLGLGTRVSFEEDGVVLPERGHATIARVDTRARWRGSRGSGLELGFVHDRRVQRAFPGLAAIASTVDQADVRLRDTRSFGATRSSAFLSFHVLEGRSDDPTGRNRARALQWTEVLTTPAHVGALLRAAYTHTATPADVRPDDRVTNLEATLTCDLPRTMETSVGGTWSDGHATHGRGVFLGSRIAFAGNKAAFEARWEYDRFVDVTTPSNSRLDRITRAWLSFNP